MSEQQYKRSSPNGDSQSKVYAAAAKAEAVAEPSGSELGKGSSLGVGRFKKNWWEVLHLLPGISGERESPHRKGRTVTLAVQRKRRASRKARHKRERQARKAMRFYGVI